MKLTDNLPKWIDWPVRIAFYALVLFILYNLARGIVIGKLNNNAMECSQMDYPHLGALKEAQNMITCLKDKNGYFENLAMRSIEQAINAMPNNPSEYVGMWNSTQPQCNYQFTLKENGEFTAQALACSISSEDFSGTWGIHENQMVWLYDNVDLWPPDINPMDVVDKDFFLLTERNGSRTRFTRVAALAAAQPTTTVQETKSVAIGDNTSIAGAKPPPSTPADIPAQWSEDELNSAQQSLDQERFTEIKIQGDSELQQYVSVEHAAEVSAILQKRKCDKDRMSILRRESKHNVVIIASGCDQPIRPTAPMVREYPRVISISDYGVREIDLSSYGFMHQSGRIGAVTDINDNGRVEFWLAGSICECEGLKEGEKCDCDGAVVVEETESLLSNGS